jgi:hypothetical protein
MSMFEGLIVAENNLSYTEARGLEQLLIDYFGGTETLRNVYNGISTSNPRRSEYIQAGAPLLDEALNIIGS